MYHGLNNQFLYTAHKILVTFADPIGNNTQKVGTCFFVKNKQEEMCLVTNRHMVDISYKNPAFQNYSLFNIEVTGKSKSHESTSVLNDLI